MLEAELGLDASPRTGIAARPMATDARKERRDVATRNDRNDLAPGTIPDAARKHIPRYPVVSATLIGRLAISTAFQVQGLGSRLLAEALRKIGECSIVGSSMIAVDAIDERAARFYHAHGFIKLPDWMRLVLPIRTVVETVSGLK